MDMNNKLKEDALKQLKKLQQAMKVSCNSSTVRAICFGKILSLLYNLREG